MVQRRGRACFLLEALQPLRIGGQTGRQDLDGDVTPQARIASPIDLAHAARAKERDDLIRAESIAGRGRHRS